MTDETVRVEITGDASGAEDAMSRASAAVKDGTEGMRDSFEGIGGALEGIEDKFTTAFKVTGIAAAYEAVKMLASEVEELAARAVKMNTLSDVLGVTVEQFQAMSLAADEAGVSDETFARAGERMVALLYQARDGSGAAIEKLLQLGVTTGQLHDPTFNLNSLLQILHDRLNDTATSQSTMNALIAELGPRAALAAEAIKRYDGSAQSVAAVMDRLNGLHHEQTTELQTELASYKALGSYLENTLTKAYLGVVDAAGDFLTVLLSTPPPSPVFAGLFGGGAAAPDTSASTAAAAQAAQQLQEIVVTAHATTLAEVQSAQELVATYQQGSAERLAAVKEYYQLAVQYYGSAEVDKVREAHKELIAEERAYRQAQLDAANEAARLMQEIDKKTTDALQHDQKEIAASAAASAKEQEDAQVGAIDRELSAIKAAGTEHKISADQELADTEKLLAEKWAAEQSYFATLRSLYAGNLAEIDKVDQQEAAAHQKILAAQQSADQLYTKKVQQDWQQAGKSIESSFTSNISKMIEGTETFSQAARSIFTSVADAIIETFVKIGVQWLETQIMSAVEGKTTAVSQITANASVAATAAMASVAAIPFYGWAMAPEVGAATYAEALSYLAGASAAGGYDIPAGVNPVTQLHAKEMVLPAQIADTVRASAAAGGGQGAARTANVTLQGKQMGNVFMAHLDDLADAFNQLVRMRGGPGKAF